MNDDIKQRVICVIAEQFGHNNAEITPEKTFEDLGADSLDAAELLIALEDEFDTQIEDEQYEKVKTVQGIFDLVSTLRI